MSTLMKPKREGVQSDWGGFCWGKNNYGYASIIMAVFIAFWIKVFFRKYQHNFFEILILLSFLMGVGMLLFSLFGLFEVKFGWKWLQFGSFFAFFISFEE